MTYPGIGIVPRAIDGKIFVTDVYDGSPAASAGVKAGDEIVSAWTARPMPRSARSPARPARRRRCSCGARRRRRPSRSTCRCRRLQPNETFENAIRASVRVIEAGNRRIGYLRIWSFASQGVEEVVMDRIASEPLKSADGLVLDMRGRWGGAPADATDIFVGKAPARRVDRPAGRRRDRQCALAQAGGRHHRRGITQRHGDSRARPEAGRRAARRRKDRRRGPRRPRLRLSDNSLMLLAVADVRVDGERLEGVGVTPDIEVPFDAPLFRRRRPAARPRGRGDAAHPDGLSRSREAGAPANPRAVVMPGLDPGIHAAASPKDATVEEWIAGSSPPMTTTLRARRLSSEP